MTRIPRRVAALACAGSAVLAAATAPNPAHAVTGSTAWAGWLDTPSANTATNDHIQFSLTSATITQAMVGQTGTITVTSEDGDSIDVGTIQVQHGTGSSWTTVPVTRTTSGTAELLQLPITTAMVGHQVQAYGRLHVIDSTRTTLGMDGSFTVLSSTQQVHAQVTNPSPSAPLPSSISATGNGDQGKATHVWATWQATSDTSNAADHVKYSVSTRTIAAGDVGSVVQISVEGDAATTVDAANSRLGWGSSWDDVTGRATVLTNGDTTTWRVPVTSDMVGSEITLGARMQTSSAASHRVAARSWIGASDCGGAVATVTDPGSTSTPGAPGVPDAAKAVGFTRLAFNDPMTSQSSIDLTGKGTTGHLWFTDRPFGGGTLPSGSLKTTSTGTTITQRDSSVNMAVATTSPTSGAGQAFHYGYFEATIAVNSTDVRHSSGWPAFWLMSTSHWNGNNASKWSEIDALELFDTYGFSDTTHPFVANWAGTVWDHAATSSGTTNTSDGPDNNQQLMPSLDVTKPHIYGLLWTRGRIGWYLDGQLIRQETYSATGQPVALSGLHTGNVDGHVQQLPAGTFSSLDSDQTGPMTMVLGTGDKDPITVSGVHVWQA